MSKVILFLICSAVSAAAGLSKLDALAMIESGNNDAAIGRAGEVSRYQIKPRIWREYTPSRAWRDVQVSAQVAQGYLADLEDTFRKQAGREATDFDRYVLWNAGPAYYARIGFSARRVHLVIRERAERYVNLRQMQEPFPTMPVPVLAVAPAPAPVRPLPPAIASPLPAFTTPLPSLAPVATVAHPIAGGRTQTGLLALGGMRTR